MAINLGSNEIKKISLGNVEIAKISLGEVEVWGSEIIVDLKSTALWEKGWITTVGSNRDDISNRKGIRIRDYINAETQRIRITNNGSQYVLLINMWNGSSHVRQFENVQNSEFDLAANTTQFKLSIRNVDGDTDVTISEATTASVKIEFL